MDFYKSTLSKVRKEKSLFDPALLEKHFGVTRFLLDVDALGLLVTSEDRGTYLRINVEGNRLEINLSDNGCATVKQFVDNESLHYNQRPVQSFNTTIKPNKAIYNKYISDALACILEQRRSQGNPCIPKRPPETPFFQKVLDFFKNFNMVSK